MVWKLVVVTPFTEVG